MNTASFLKSVDYKTEKIETKVVIETSFSKEIRIVLGKGMHMKEHKTAFPILVQVLVGAIDFGVQNQKQKLVAGDIIGLESNVLHDLYAIKDSVVRLSLSKLDKIERVQDVISQP